MEVFLDAEATQEGCCIAFSVPSVELCKLFFEFRYAEAILVRKVGLGLERIAFVHDVPKHGVTHQHGVEHGVLVPLEVVLTEH